MGTLTDEVIIIANGLRGTIVEEDSSCGEKFTVYGVMTRRKLPNGTVRKEKNWYFCEEFVRLMSVPYKEVPQAV